MDAETSVQKKLIHKISGELKHYAVLSVYLYICFGSIILYKTAVLQGYGINYEPYGLAAVKALIMAKFMLVGNMLHKGEIIRRRALVYTIIYKSLGYLGLLVVLSLLEEVIAGFMHGRSAAESISGSAGGTGLQIIATCLLLWLILVPVVTVQQVMAVLGKDRLYQMFFVGQR